MKEATEKFGSILDLNLPIGKFGLVTDPKYAQHILVSNHENYQKSDGYKQVAKVLGNGLLTAEGSFWHKNRKMLQPSFHKGELRKLLPAIWQTGIQYLNGIDHRTELMLDTEMSGLTLTILLNSLIHSNDSEIEEKMSEHVTFGQEFIVGRIRNPFKWPVWVPTVENRRYQSMMADSNRLIQKAIDDRRTTDEEVLEDLLSVLLENYHPTEGFGQIRDEILTFLVAGHETSALGMTWGLHLLAHHPEIQDRLYQEVQGLRQLEDLDLMNYSNLKFTTNVVKEVLRMYPPAWNIVRKAKENDEIGGKIIEKGRQMMISIYELHHNPTYWDDPFRFNPDRFASYNFKHKFQYLPFGGGPRFCIGNNFALFEMTILLVQFVQKFQLDPITLRDIGFNPLLTLRPDQPVKIRMKKRE